MTLVAFYGFWLNILTTIKRIAKKFDKLINVLLSLAIQCPVQYT